VYTLIHRDGKSGSYYVKRFLLENTAIGKRTSLINEEPGSKMVLITNALNPLVKIDITKGKSKVPESYEENLAEFIDVKGMKAQGNRLSPHDIVNVELLSVENTEDSPISEPDNVLPDEEGNDKEVESKKERVKVDLEITNPDEVEIDDKGQIGLF